MEPVKPTRPKRVEQVVHSPFVMKTICIFLAVYFFGAIYSSAQQPAGAKKGLPERVAKFCDKLGAAVKLTQAQYDKVYQLQLSSLEQMRAIRQDLKAQGVRPGPGTKQQMRNIQMNRIIGMKSILTPEQWPQFLVWREDQRIAHYQKRQNKGAAPGSGQAPMQEDDDDDLD
jgi:hypothetical protein